MMTVQAALGILRDSLGLAVGPSAEEVGPQSLCFTSLAGFSSAGSGSFLTVAVSVSGLSLCFDWWIYLDLAFPWD